MATATKAKKIVYVPILKSKSGERWALSHLKAATKPRIRPLLELHTHKSKGISDHVETLCGELEADWGINRSFYVDTIWLHGDAGNPAIISDVYEQAFACGLRAVPVARLTFDDASLEQLRGAVEAGGGRGYLIRVIPDHLADHDSIEAVVEAMGIPKDSIDFLVDYRSAPMDPAADLPRVPTIGAWRRLITSSGAFPKSLADYSLHTWHSMPRTDWESWSAGVEGTLPRRPIFSDYTMRAPGAPSDFGEPPVALRYTTDANWLVRIDGRHKAGDAPLMHDQCASLVDRDEFSGVGFSDGDDEINDTATPEEGDGPGGPTQWLQWCVNHHIAFVVDQLGDAT